jgi:hypothetical protein
VKIRTITMIALMAAACGGGGGDSPAPDATTPTGGGSGAGGGSGGGGGAGGAQTGGVPGPEADARAPLPDLGPANDATVDAALVPDAAEIADQGVPGADAGFEQDPARLELHGPCPPGLRFGGFKVESNEADAYTAIDGVVKNGVAPNLIPEDAGADGDCRLNRARRLVCDPPCGAGNTCDTGGVCIPTPLGQDMGPVVFRGLAEPVTLTALQPGSTYFYTRLPHPGFQVGQVVQLTNTPGYLGPLALYGVGVSPIEAGDAAWTLSQGMPMHVRWTPPPADARSRVLIEMNVDQHGLTPITLVCDVPDTGEAVLPQGATDALIAAGVTGFPSGRLTRRTADSFTEADRCVDFFVTSVRAVDVEVAGHVPCIGDADCPPAETCDLLIQQCH